MVVIRKIILIKLSIFLCLFAVNLPVLSATDIALDPSSDFATDELLVKYHTKANYSTAIGYGDESIEIEEEFIHKLGLNYRLWDGASEDEKLDLVNNKIKKARKNQKFKKLKRLKKLKKSLASDFAVLKLDGNLSKKELKALVRKMNREKFNNSQYEIEAAYPNYTYEISEVNDPLHSQQWSHQVVEPERLWNYTKGAGAVVAVIDTGVDYTHEDLADNIWVNEDEIPFNGKDDDNNGYIDDVRGWDFVDRAGAGCIGSEDCSGEDNDPKDVNGHGTHVAGIIAAVQNNNKGISGIAPEAKIMPLKAGYSVGFSAYLKTSDIIQAITYAVENDADVINMSFAGYGLDVLSEVLDLAKSLGVVAVAAAGNNSSNVKIYPAALPNVIAVGALADQSSKAYFSNYGDWVDIVAPGTWLLSTVPGNKYDYKSGTSMASPVVAGVAALIKAKSRVEKLSVDEVKDLLVSSAFETSFPVVRGGLETIGGVTGAIDFGLAIDNLSIPGNALIGEAVSFSVEASDSDSSIVAYEWVSDLDGFLSSSASFSVSDLSLGSHAITVRVKNSDGEWSDPEFKILNVSETRNTGTLSVADTIQFRMRRRHKRFYAGLSRRSRKEVQAYKWISSKDGTVSERRSFKKNNLSPGYHQLSLLVQDKDGNWSNPIERVVEI